MEPVGRKECIMKGKFILLVFILIGALAVSAPVLGQEYDEAGDRIGKQKNRGKHQRAGKGMRGEGMGMRQAVRLELFQYLYPVRLIRRHSADLELTDKQVEKLQKVVGAVQGEIGKLKWDVDREAQKLLDLVREGGTKEKVYKQMDRVFKYENKIKKKHLGLMIVVKDILTPEQRAYLDEVKKKKMEQFNDDFDGSRRRGKRGGPGAPRF
jgi:Spy/CpxP family protein refolding chaperone